MTDENDQQTLQDLFRVINDMRGEMNARFDEASAEREAMRNVIDSLASQDDFADLDRKIAAVAVDTKATRTDVNNLKAEVSRLKASVKTAGIPVR